MGKMLENVRSLRLSSKSKLEEMMLIEEVSWS